ncbi:hypothetical protein [Microbacterium candidum]|uniref:Uncharacterized protein n=1 Tax=Microbacterium candidum TaxID=3041922 RepID=A0ABT7MWM5_9MICO|nr:hypothetical protein [Microbacterium sp. ASV49]MDL9978839.1 hypothetical protein [Microbacterium sp. ASV49]
MSTAIKRDADSRKVPPASTTNEDRVCRSTTSKDRGYCGRRSAPLAATWAGTVCNDCKAAARADGLDV